MVMHKVTVRIYFEYIAFEISARRTYAAVQIGI